jgi:GDP-L-fucose synthase
MRGLMTGASGFLGRHLAAALRRAGHEITGLGSREADLTRDGSLERFDGPYDVVWHLAAWTQAGDFCLHHPGEQWIVNQRINTTVLDWWRRRQPQAKLVAIGTSCAYAPGGPLREDRYLLGQPVPELYAYAMTKRMLLVGLESLALQYGLRYLYLVPNTLFGPEYHTDGRQAHFIFDLTRKIVGAARHGDRVVLWGDGSQCREVVFVGDMVQAAMQLVDRVDNAVVNVGNGQEFPIHWYAERIARAVGVDPSAIEYDDTKYVGVRSKVLEIGTLRRLLPSWAPTSFEIALAATLEWYLRSGSSGAETHA